MAGRYKPTEYPGVIKTVQAMLEQAAQTHADKANEGTTYSIGHPFHRIVSGEVRMRDDFQTYHYNMPTAWDLALEVGNNIKGAKALDVARQIFDVILDKLDDGQVTVERRGSGATISHEGNKLYLEYDFASSFCWVAARVIELAPSAESDADTTARRSMRLGQ